MFRCGGSGGTNDVKLIPSQIGQNISKANYTVELSTNCVGFAFGCGNYLPTITVDNVDVSSSDGYLSTYFSSGGTMRVYYVFGEFGGKTLLIKGNGSNLTLIEILKEV